MTLLGYCFVVSPNEAMGSGAVTNAAAEGMGSGEYTTCCEVDTGALGLAALEKVANEAIGSGTFTKATAEAIGRGEVTKTVVKLLLTRLKDYCLGDG